MDVGESLLPPDDVDKSFVELEIMDVNDPEHFFVKIIGSDVDTNMDGRVVKLPRTEDQLKLMSAGEIFKMPA
jgi:hypothetical protein